MLLSFVVVNGLGSKSVKTYKAKIRHSERSRGIFAFGYHLQPNRCQDPSTRFRSLRMTAAFIVLMLYMLLKADNHIICFQESIAHPWEFVQK